MPLKADVRQALEPGPLNGVVTDNDDPEGLHRVRIEIPGYVDKTTWARPITMGGGSPQRGGHMVPAVGSDVVVWFLNGDVESPIYAGFAWGKPNDAGSEAPELLKDAAEEAHLVQSLQVGDLLFTIDEREREGEVGQFFAVENLISGDQIMFDLSQQSISIRATSLLELFCDGVVSITGSQVTINGRRVLSAADKQI